MQAITIRANLTENTIKMKLSKFIVITGVLLSTIHYANSQNRLVTYPAPEGADLMNDFTVKVRETGKDWKPVDTYLVKVDEVRNIKHHVERASMSYFDFSGEVEVSVTFNHGAIQSGRVRPLSYGITPTITNNTMTFKLNRPRNLSVEVNGEKQLDYQGCLAINAGDNNLIRNVRFENIRIEDFRQGQLVNLRIFFNEKYCKAPGRGIENILFKDISYTGKDAEVSMIIGYDKERKVKNIRFENLTINGEVIYDDMPEKPKWYKTGDMARIFVGEHTEEVTFSK